MPIWYDKLQEDLRSDYSHSIPNYGPEAAVRLPIWETYIIPLVMNTTLNPPHMEWEQRLTMLMRDLFRRLNYICESAEIGGKKLGSMTAIWCKMLSTIPRVAIGSGGPHYTLTICPSPLKKRTIEEKIKNMRNQPKMWTDLKKKCRPRVLQSDGKRSTHV